MGKATKDQSLRPIKFQAKIKKKWAAESGGIPMVGSAEGQPLPLARGLLAESVDRLLKMGGSKKVTSKNKEKKVAPASGQKAKKEGGVKQNETGKSPQKKRK